MKNIIKYTIMYVTVISLVSCENWLDATPPSEIRAGDHYSSAEGFQQTLLGCYIAMTRTDLYGENLTWHMLDMLGRQYDARRNSGAADYALDRYNYQATASVKVVENIWDKAYSVIADANEALLYADLNRNRLDTVNYRIIKGELLAVRAYMHFDLMRLFGRSNLAGRTDLASLRTVPYQTSVVKNVSPQLSYAQTIDNILSDLAEAARLLEIDPVRRRHSETIYAEANIDGFYNYRQLHLNYFAVKALQARVYMWEGSADSKREALKAALEVIEDPARYTMNTGLTMRTFTPQDVVSTTHMCFPDEHIFALDVADLATRIETNLNREYSQDDRQYRTLSIANTVADNLYEITTAGMADCRYKQLYTNTEYWPEGTKTPSKLYQTTSSGAYYNYNNTLPLIRLPELYYIAAECHATGPAPDLAEARRLLETVRNARAVYDDLDPSLDRAGVMNEIEKEYRKEFICEGVVFYFFKRLGYDKLPRQSDVMGSAVAIGDAVYMLPYPDFELRSGRVQ